MRTTPPVSRRFCLIVRDDRRPAGSGSNCIGRIRNIRRSPDFWRAWRGCGGKRLNEPSAGRSASTVWRLVMTIQWMKDVDLALAEARGKDKAVLIDFNAAPM